MKSIRFQTALAALLTVGSALLVGGGFWGP